VPYQEETPSHQSPFLWNRPAWLQKVPHVAVEIFEYGNGAERLLLGRTNKLNALRFEALVVTPKVIGVEE
jgi:hypothetical protein